MDALEKWMIILFELYLTTTLNKMDVLPKSVVQIILAPNWLVRHSKYIPQPIATTFAFSSVFILLYDHHQPLIEEHPPFPHPAKLVP